MKVYPGAPHGLANAAARKDTLNTDLLAFLRGWPVPALPGPAGQHHPRTVSYWSPARMDVMRCVLKPSQCMRPA